MDVMISLEVTTLHGTEAEKRARLFPLQSLMVDDYTERGSAQVVPNRCVIHYYGNCYKVFGIDKKGIENEMGKNGIKIITIKH